MWFKNIPDPIDIIIGSTGYYEIFIDNEYPLIKVLSLNDSNARLEYSYLKETYLPIKVKINDKEWKELKSILNIENIE